MFRDITSILNKRNKSLTSIGQDNREAKQALQEFLVAEFGEGALEFKIAIEPDKRMGGFKIITSSKTIATEINLKIESLRRYLKGRGLRTDKLVIK